MPQPTGSTWVWPPAVETMIRQGFALACALAVPVGALVSWPPQARPLTSNPSVLQRLRLEAGKPITGDTDKAVLQHWTTGRHSSESDVVPNQSQLEAELRAQIRDFFCTDTESLSAASASTILDKINRYEKVRSSRIGDGFYDTGSSSDLCEPPTPGGSVFTTARVVRMWRNKLRQRIVLALERATQMQLCGSVAELLEVYERSLGIQARSVTAASKVEETMVDDAGDNTDESMIVGRARTLLSNRWSVWRHRLKMLARIARKNLVWIALGIGAGVVRGIWQSVFYHFFSILQSAAFGGEVKKARNAAVALFVHQVVARLLERAGAECVARGEKAVKSSVQQRLFERLIRAPLVFHDRLPPGASAGFLRDSAELEDGVFHVPIEIAKTIGTLIPVVVAVSRRMTFPLFVVVGIMGPGLAVVSSIAAVKATAAQRSIRALQDARRADDELILGSHLTTIRAFHDEAYEIARYGEYLARHESLDRAALVAGTFGDVNYIVGQVGRLGLFVVLAGMVRSKALDPADFLGFADQINVGLNSLTSLYESCAYGWRALDPAGRVLELLGVQGEEDGIDSQPPQPQLLEETTSDGLVSRGAVQFSDVWFSYPLRRSSAVLKGVSFQIPAGTATGIVGPSGCGKSTILALLQRLYAPTRGSITIDGVDISTMRIGDLRQSLSIVAQDPKVFPRRSVRGNVLVGTGGKLEVVAGSLEQQDIDELVRTALADAELLDFCDSLPEGLDSWVGGGGSNSAESSGDLSPNNLEGGGALSGGQRARLAIARAMARHAPLLLLDEAFSNLDAASQSNVRASLQRILQRRGQTVIAVSHQLRSLSWVDQIIVLGPNGKLAEVGSFEELAKKPNGIFAGMLAQTS